MKRLLTLLGGFWKPISLNAAFFVFMYALGYLCTQTELPVGVRNAKPYELSATELFFDLYLLCALLAVIPAVVRKWVRLIVAVVLYAVALADMFCYSNFQSTLTPTMLMLLFETNGREAGEFLHAYVGSNLFAPPTGWVLLIALLHALWAAVRGWSKRRKWLGPRLAKPAQLWLCALLGLSAIGLFGYSAMACWPNKKAMQRLLTKHDVGQVEHELTTADRAQLYLPVYRLAFALRANKLASQETDHLVARIGQVAVDSCDFRSPQIVLIIGESYNRHRSQLYGYPHPTTPRQMERLRDSSLVCFDDVVAPWNLTSFVFKQMFSLHATGEPGEWYDAPLFPELFRQAGYSVALLTNQFLPKAGEAVFDFNGGFFLNQPTLSQAMFDIRNSQRHAYDEGLLGDYDALVAPKNNDHQLTIFHLMGQHVDYRGRFPIRTRRKFRPKDYDRPDLEPRLQQINADYDNAVLYNDSVVDQILRRFEQKNAIVIYVPDHGEECFNGKLAFYGRMHSAVVDRRLAREEFEIPFWIWASEQYRATHPYGWAAIRKYRHRAYMTDLLPHTLLFLGGIHTSAYRPDYDLLNSAYNELRPRLLKNSVDYNRLKTEDR